MTRKDRPTLTEITGQHLNLGVTLTLRACRKVQRVIVPNLFKFFFVLDNLQQLGARLTNFIR